MLLQYLPQDLANVSATNQSLQFAIVADYLRIFSNAISFQSTKYFPICIVPTTTHIWLPQ
jgi:hypothetical protein